MTANHPTASITTRTEGGAIAGRWKANPYLHCDDGRIYNPHTDRTVRRGEPGYASLRALLDSRRASDVPNAELDVLIRDGWLIAADADPDRWHRLKYVSLEAHTVCNQACYFCPVSVAPRERYFMPMPLYERIVGEIADLDDPIEGVFMISYNEPTIDPRFVDQVRCLREAGLPAAVLTNGTGLTPATVDSLREMNGIDYLSVNLSTLDRERYRADREGDHLKQVLKYLDYVGRHPVARKMDIVVLGTGDETHRRDHEEIRARFEGTPFEVRFFIVDDRASYFQIGTAEARDGHLCGCDNMGSRPIQHLHIDPEGKCFLCCQDYSETVIVGDLVHSSVREVLQGREFARARRQVYGLEEAPDDFVCRRCSFALRSDHRKGVSPRSS